MRVSRTKYAIILTWQFLASDQIQGLADDAQSSLVSLSSSIVNGVEENGRTYAAYGKEGTKTIFHSPNSLHPFR